MAKCRFCTKSLIFISTLFYRLVFCVSACVTNGGQYDLTPLSRFIWNITYMQGSDLIAYKIDLCSPLVLGDNCTNSSVCKIESNFNRTFDLGGYVSVLSPYENTSARPGDFWLNFTGESCIEGGRFHTFIKMQCGKGLGSPHVMSIQGCHTYFLWETSVVCQPSLVQKQVPCYTYDPQGNKYDLNGLMRDKSGYLLTTGIDPVNFYINICADIIEDNNVSGCPRGAGSCRKIGQEVTGFGEVDQPPTWRKDGTLRLTYVGKNVSSDCADVKTVIDFHCPSSGPGKVPVILVNNGCYYHIEWSVVQACPIPQLESSDDCKLISNPHGLSIDLSPLQMVSGIPHHAERRIKERLYNFYFGLCGGFPPDYQCASGYNSSLVRVCQKSIDDIQGMIIGTSVNQTLRFSDNQIYLSYTSSSICKTRNSINKTFATVIIFKCRQYASGSGVGEPVFIQEMDCVSFFLWETQFACLERADKSVCYDGNDGHLIDLTPLRKSGGEKPWQAITSGTGNHSFVDMQVYINVCGPVGCSDFVNCPSKAAVCVKDKDKVVNFGQFISPPFTDPATKDVLLNYSSGEPCSSNVNKSRMSLIRFICRPGLMNLNPRLVYSSVDGCFLEFEWPTGAACSQMLVEGDNCKISNATGGISFDLNPLRSSTYYNVSTTDYDYYINVCGDLKNAPCMQHQEQIASCQVNKLNNSVSLGKPSHKLVYYNGLIHMTFINGTPYNDTVHIPRQTILIFMCDHNAGIGSPVFVEETDYIYSFKWKTSQVCPPKPIQCIYTDKKTFAQYDLTRLTRDMHQGNWEINEVQGSRKFYLNVCQNLVLRDGKDDNVEFHCDPSAAICATNITNGKEETSIPNLGKAELNPYFEEGKLVLKYTSGQSCLHEAINQNYSALIYFMCANDSLSKQGDEGEPRFLRAIRCQYIFLWNTPAACPLQTVEMSGGCSIRNPNSGMIYSFESLDQTFHIPGSEFSRFQNFSLSICGFLDSSLCLLPSNHSSKISACGRLKKDDQTIVLGMSSTRRLEFSGEDSVIVHFTGPKNSASTHPDYQLDIIFVCRRHLESSRPKFLRQEDRLLVFIYETAMTCPPQEVDCIYHNGRGSTYDLSRLGSRGSGHYEVTDPRPGKENIVYYLNACRVVNAPNSSNCHVNGGAVGACEVDTVDGKTWSMGHIQGKPQMNNYGQPLLILRYLNGDLCDQGQFYRSTRINFICSANEEHPRFVSETMQCEYVFEWETPEACPVRRTIGRNCKVIDPVYSNTFDLSKLSNAAGYVVSFGDIKFKINVCARLLSGCNTESQAGVCIERNEQQISGGNYSDVLVYDGGQIMLKYSGNGTSTSFLFLCDYSTIGSEGPTYLNSSSNEDLYIFAWKTSYACRDYKEISCHALGPNNTHYDLSSLKLLDGNYELITNDGKLKYFINVCRSVVQMKDVECHYGTGICAVNLSEANVEKRYASLGEVESSPFVENGVLKLVYDMGKLCLNMHTKTTILFYCAHHITNGKPEFLTERFCEYVFVWYTSAACPVPRQDIIGKECTVINPNTGYKFDFKSLQEVPYVVPTAENTSLIFGICESAQNNPCGSNIGSCLEKTSGSIQEFHQNVGIANSKLHYHNGELMLKYSDGDWCTYGNGTVGWSTVITFLCRTEDVMSEPYLLDVRNCTYYIEWHTKLACEKQMQCSVEVDDEIFDLSLLGEYIGHHIAFSTDDTDDAKYLLNVCKPVNPFGSLSHCPSDAAICRIDPSSNISSSLGIAENPPTVDDRGQIILEYTHGSKCPFDEKFNASSRIIFKCDDRMIPDMLQMVEVIPNCTFIFEWPTDVVCRSKVHEEVADNCSYFDLRLKMKYDLNQLQAQSSDSFRIDTKYGLFSISLCGHTSKNGPCAMSGVCLRKDGIDHSWGSATSKIISADDSEILKVFFKNGDSCQTGEDQLNRHSAVWFICDENAGLGWPKLSRLDGCEAIFTWQTSFFCPVRESNCAVIHEGNLYDLRLLSSHSHSWIIDTSEGEKFWINVCASLGGRSDPRCPSDSTVCWKTSAGKVISLGAQQNQHLFMADNGQSLVLRYSTSTNACFHGSDNAGLPTFSEIRFKCSPEVHSLRLLNRGSKFNNCTFTFEWETPIACKGHKIVEVLENNGVMKDVKRGIYMDLLPLLEAQETAIEDRGNDKYLYHISLLGLTGFKNGVCNGAAICQTKIGENTFQKNIGSFKSKKFFIQGAEFVLTLQSDSPCARNIQKNVTSHIRLHCSANAGKGNPEFFYESDDCDYIFTWQTTHVCDVFNVSYQSYNEPPEMPSSSNVGLIVGLCIAVVILAAVVFLIYRNKDRRCLFASRQSLTSFSSQLTSLRQGHSSISFARLSEEDATA